MKTQLKQKPKTQRYTYFLELFISNFLLSLVKLFDLSSNKEQDKMAPKTGHSRYVDEFLEQYEHSEDDEKLKMIQRYEQNLFRNKLEFKDV